MRQPGTTRVSELFMNLVTFRHVLENPQDLSMFEQEQRDRIVARFKRLIQPHTDILEQRLEKDYGAGNRTTFPPRGEI
ncbi:hypothetical protein ACFLU6_02705 [Acidobacteriota bacterium]